MVATVATVQDFTEIVYRTVATSLHAILAEMSPTCQDSCARVIYIFMHNWNLKQTKNVSL